MDVDAQEDPLLAPPDTVNSIHMRADLASPGYKVTPNPKFLREHPENISLYLSAEQVPAYAQSFEQDERFKEVAARICASAEKKVQSGSLGKVPKQYLFWFAGAIEGMAAAYLLSGDPKVGAFLKYLVLDTARRPCGYYTDRLIRAFKASDPVGDLETSSLSAAMARAAWFGRDLWTDEEWKEIQDAIRDKLMLMNMNKLRTLPGNNYRAVIGFGAFMSARACGDTATAEKALGITLSFAADLLEKDGSSSEQVDYFFFPVSKVVSALMLLAPNERTAALAATPLKGSIPWVLSHFYYASDCTFADKIKINFGDSDLGGKKASTNAGTGSGWTEERLSLLFLAQSYGQPEGLWLIKQFFSTVAPRNFDETLLWHKFPGASWDAGTPAQPLSSVYESGTAVFRSAWENDGCIAAIRGGAGGRTQYSHDRANRGAITLFARGEAFIMTPGRFSYRNPMHKTYDMRTVNHSLVTIGDRDEIEKPVSVFGPLSDDGARASILLDLTKSWEGVTYASRRVYFDRTHGFTLTADRVVLPEADILKSRYLLNNIDGKLRLETPDSLTYIARRPKASLLIAGVFNSDASAAVDEGYISTTYSYAIGDPGEGKKGSGMMLVYTGGSAMTHTVLSLYLPMTADTAPPVIERSDKALVFTAAGSRVKAEIVSNTDGTRLLITESNPGRAPIVNSYGL